MLSGLETLEGVVGFESAVALMGSNLPREGSLQEIGTKTRPALIRATAYLSSLSTPHNLYYLRMGHLPLYSAPPVLALTLSWALVHASLTQCQLL